MPGSTSRGITFPVNGDIMEPLAGWFAQQAASTNDAIDDIYTALEEPDYPFPLTSHGVERQEVTSTAWADIPNINPITLTLPRACWVDISFGAWLDVNPNGWLRASTRVTGATVLGETQIEVGGSVNGWGQVLYQEGASGTNGSRASHTSNRLIRFNAGESIITARSYGSAAAGKSVDYPCIQVSPIRWA